MLTSSDKLVGTFWRLRYADNSREKASVFVVLGRDTNRNKHQFFLLDLEKLEGFWGAPTSLDTMFYVWFPGYSLRSMERDEDS